MSNPNFIGPWGQTPQWPSAAPVVLATPSPWPVQGNELPPQYVFAPNAGFENPAVPEHQRARAYSHGAYAHAASQQYARQMVMQQQQHEQQLKEEKRRQKQHANDKQGWRSLSRLYPELHPVLAVDSVQFYWDVRKKPGYEIHQATFHTNKDDPVFRDGSRNMRLFSKQMPWTIDIKIEDQSLAFNVLLVWDAVYKALQQEVLDAEWALIGNDKKQKERMEKAWAERTRGKTNKKLRRIDWLGNTVMFRGLERDDDFIRTHRLRPGETLMAYDWMLRLCD